MTSSEQASRMPGTPERSNSRSRFKETLAHHTPERPMIDYIAERETDSRLKKHLGCADEAGLLDAIGADFFYLPARDISQNEGFVPFYRGPELAENDSERRCPFGIRFSRGAYDAKFTVDHAIEGPLERATSSREILSHRWPTRNDFDFEPIGGIAEANRNRVIVGGLWSGILGDVIRMYGFQRFLTDLALAPERVHTLVDRVTEVYLDLNDHLFELLRGKLDVFFFGNDFGSQNGLLMSVEMWSDFYFENIRKLCALAHSYGLTVMMHSCGAVAELVEPLIEAGVDILDPVQTSANGMSPESLVERFGGRIVFHGGIDTQHVLPTASSDEVAAHVKSIVETFSSGGGYIACGSQLFGPDIPIENIVTVYRTLAEHRPADTE